MKETLTFRLALVFQIQEMTVKFLILIWVYFMNKLLYYKKIKVFRTITLEKIKYGLLKKAYSNVLSKCSCSGKFYWNPKKTLWVEYLFTKHTDWANILNDKFLALSFSLSLCNFVKYFKAALSHNDLPLVSFEQPFLFFTTYFFQHGLYFHINNKKVSDMKKQSYFNKFKRGINKKIIRMIRVMPMMMINNFGWQWTILWYGEPTNVLKLYFQKRTYSEVSPLWFTNTLK